MCTHNGPLNMIDSAILPPAIWRNITGLAEMVGQVEHLPYHFLVVHTGYDVCYDFFQDSEVGELRSQSHNVPVHG